jgi:hypothetical protein
MRGLLGALCMVGVLASAAARAEPFRIACYVRDDAVSVNCPEADHVFLKHMAWLYAGMFRDHMFPLQDLRAGDTLSCGVDTKHDLTDCVVSDQKLK